jgi:hypothetical protein
VARPNDEDDDLFDTLSYAADRAGLKGRSRSKFIDDFMGAAGYEPQQTRESYRRRPQEDDDDDEGGSGYFRRGRRNQDRSRRSRNDDDDRF